MAGTNSTAPKSFDVAIDMLFDVSALIECAESQLENDAGSPTVRTLRIAFDKLKDATNMVDELASKKESKPSPQMTNVDIVDSVAAQCCTGFCRINTMLDLMQNEVKKHNNNDFDAIEALLPAVMTELDALWKAIDQNATV